MKPFAVFIPAAAALTLLAPPLGVSQSSAAAPRLEPRPSGVSDFQLSIWNSQGFQRRFAESYLAETEIEPTVTADEREALTEVFDLIRNERLDEALEMLRGETDETSSAVFDFTIANIHFQREQWDRAIEHYAKAVDKFPNFRRAWDNASKIFVREGNYDKAVEALTRVIELGGDNAITYGLLGFSYSSLERPISAESAYRQAIMLDSETMDWKLGLARSFFRQQRYADAQAYCDRLIELDPDRVDFWLLQANAFIGLDQAMKAAENYEMVDALGGSTPNSLNTLADIYINAELYDRAVDAYARALAMQETGGVDRALRAAKVLAARGSYDAVEALVGDLQRLREGKLGDGERKELLKLEARVAVARGADEKEVEVLREIVDLDPMDGEALMLLGQYFRRDGDAEQAMFYYQRAEGIEGYEADAMVRQAQILVKRGEYRQALSLLKSAQRINYRDNVQEYLQQVERVSQSG
mgnify:CR=1 FL=1